MRRRPDAAGPLPPPALGSLRGLWARPGREGLRPRRPQPVGGLLPRLPAGGAPGGPGAVSSKRSALGAGHLARLAEGASGMSEQKKIALTEDEVRRLVAMAQAEGAARVERMRHQAESEYRAFQAQVEAMEWGQWSPPEDELRALMARGRHHRLCRLERGMGRYCTCGIDALMERD